MGWVSCSLLEFGSDSWDSARDEGLDLCELARLGLGSSGLEALELRSLGEGLDEDEDGWT